MESPESALVLLVVLLLLVLLVFGELLLLLLDVEPWEALEGWEEAGSTFSLSDSSSAMAFLQKSRTLAKYLRLSSSSCSSPSSWDSSWDELHAVVSDLKDAYAKELKRWRFHM